MAAKTASTKAKAKKVVEPEPDDDDEDGVDAELEELEGDDTEETQPAKSNGKAKQPTVEFGAAQLAAYLAEKHEKKLDARGLRTLLRKMARDGRINREIVQGNRTRYSWSGPKDPEVKLIEKAFVAGELDQDKAEKLQALKDRKKEKDAAKATAGSGKKSKKATKRVVEVDEDDDDE